MSNIKKIEIINNALLSEEHYFQSLIGEAHRLNLLTDTDIEKIQYDCIELLAKKIEKYNGYDSSSIRAEAAQNIMKSNLYTIGLWLKTYSCPDDAVVALKESPLNELYDNGRKKINSLLKATRAFHLIVLKNIVKTDNYTYNATIIDGIKGFFKIYNPDYEANDIRITADYPLFNPAKNLAGIEFIKQYLNSVHQENIFCNNFLPEDIHQLLGGYDKNYKDLVINIYEFVLSTAVGCTISNSDVCHLNLSNLNIDYLYNLLSEKSRTEIEYIVQNAVLKMQEKLQIKSNSQIEYLNKSIPIISANIHNAVKMHTLDKIFITTKSAEIKDKIYFSFGEKMDNKRYREIVEEIMQCRYLSDKVAIIKLQIKSLADLEDVLLDAELLSEEIITILKELSLVEIAVLLKKYPFKHEIEAVELRMSEQKLCKCLNEYVMSLSQKQQVLIAEQLSKF